jgi:hypothetical protein
VIVQLRKTLLFDAPAETVKRTQGDIFGIDHLAMPHLQSVVCQMDEAVEEDFPQSLRSEVITFLQAPHPPSSRRIAERHSLIRQAYERWSAFIRSR